MFEKILLSPKENTGGSEPKKSERKSDRKERLSSKFELTLHGSLLPTDGIEEIKDEMAHDPRKRFRGKLEAVVIAESLPRTKSNPTSGSEAYLAIWKYRDPKKGTNMVILVEMLFTGVIGVSSLKKDAGRGEDADQGFRGSFKVYSDFELGRNPQLVLDDSMRLHLGEQLTKLGYSIDKPRPRNVAGRAYMPDKPSDPMKEAVIQELFNIHSRNYDAILTVWDILLKELKLEDASRFTDKEGRAYSEISELIGKIKDAENKDELERAKKIRAQIAKKLNMLWYNDPDAQWGKH